MGLSIDREKAINGLEKLREDLGYGLPDRSNVVMEYLNSLTDAIALLKEQEEMEPRQVNVYGQWGKVSYGHCPKCGAVMSSAMNPHLCRCCGQAVKWDGDD